MRPKFQVEADPHDASDRCFIDPETLDTSEQAFTASLNQPPRTPRFVVNTIDEEVSAPAGEPPAGDPVEGTLSDAEDPTAMHSEAAPADAACRPAAPAQDSCDWRGEVAARVNQYRARRRPRAPRYPSLLLKFDPPPLLRDLPAEIRHEQAAIKHSQAAAAVVSRSLDPEPMYQTQLAPAPVVIPETTARIIEFPRSFAPPAARDELAEPVLTIPRILDVPEPQPLPPALGGIAIEPTEDAGEKRRGFELPLQTAPLVRRVLAGLVDLLMVLVASGCFVAVVYKMNTTLTALQLLTLICMTTALSWVGYQGLVLPTAGTTLGLRAAQLQVTLFDGGTAPRRLRYWRVMASVLSLFSLGFGYLWCMLDQDQLCWHDRITRTYLAPQPQSEKLQNSGDVPA